MRLWHHKRVDEPRSCPPPQPRHAARDLRVLLGERQSRRSGPGRVANQDHWDRYQADDAARPFSNRHFPLTIPVAGFSVNEWSALRTVSGAYSSQAWSEHTRALQSDHFMPPCVIERSRRSQELAAEASRTVGDALTRLPRHCGVDELPLPHPTAAASPRPGACMTARSRAAGRVHALQATEAKKKKKKIKLLFYLQQQSQVWVFTDTNEQNAKVFK